MEAPEFIVLTLSYADQATALMYAKAKAKAIGICARTIHELIETEREILSASPNTKVHLQVVGVTKEEDVASFLETLTSLFGVVDVAVSNAGAKSCLQKISLTDTERWWEDVVRPSPDRGNVVEGC